MRKNTGISVRISEIIDCLGVTRNIFAKALGYSRSQSIYDIINGKSKPSFDFFNKFYNSEFSALINPIWLLTGKGEMLLSEKEKLVSEVLDCKECEKLKEKINLLEQVIEAKNETIKALQNKDSNESSKR